MKDGILSSKKIIVVLTSLPAECDFIALHWLGAVLKFAYRRYGYIKVLGLKPSTT